MKSRLSAFRAAGGGWQGVPMSKHSRYERCYERQGIRLLLLGLGVLTVLLVVVMLTFEAVDEGMDYLISTKAWPVALGALIFGALAGIATVVKAIAEPMGKVVDIVGRRKPPP